VYIKVKWEGFSSYIAGAVSGIAGRQRYLHHTRKEAWKNLCCG
jgi:hypothetical protein